LKETIEMVRDLSYNLRPPALDQMGMNEAINQHCEDFSEKTGLKVDFNFAGMDHLILDSDTEINIYRIIQEALNNIWKHADASHVNIRLLGASPNIILRIEDNGRGFDVEKREATLHHEKRLGLSSMKERVRLLEGEMEIQSRPMKGTKIFIKVPYREWKE
jgi:signal transduction histidine kinase